MGRRRGRARVLSAPVGVAGDFFVSPTGSDGNPGTFSQPFQTIGAAKTAVRAQTSSMAADITVYLRGGRYALTATESFTASDSGLNGFRVLWKAYPGETVRISGGQTITGWSDQGGGIWRASTGLAFRQLYVDGVRAIRARLPNAGTYYSLGSYNEGPDTLTMQTGTMANWGNPTQVEVVIIQRGVNDAHLRIASRAGDTITPAATERTRLFTQSYPIKESGRPYFYENALEFLTQQGEFYLDTVNDFVYYMPRGGENMTTSEVIVPQVEKLVSVAGTSGSQIHDIEFHGMIFEHATYLNPDNEGHVGDQASTYFIDALPGDQITSYPSGRLPAAVYVEYADDFRFERCGFRHCGASGINLYQGCTDGVLIGNWLHDLSGSGISVDLALLGNTANANIPCRRITVSNNYLKQWGQEFYHAVAIMLAYVDTPLVEQNEITDGPYVGISSGWGWAYASNTMSGAIIRRNKVWNVCKLESDSSGIYTLSDHNGGLIEHNYVHDIVRVTGIQGAYNISGLYEDEGSGDLTVQNNVVDVPDADGVDFTNNVGSNLTRTNNGPTITGFAAIIAAAGLEAAYDDIRDLVP
jgi:hypothetical protein